MMKQTAQLNYLRMAPRKVRLLGDMLKGMAVNEAEAQLVFERKRASKPLLKLLRSAVANAKNSKKMNPENLVIENVRVDKGPIMKRSLPRARGMATPIHKIMSHVTITLVEKSDMKPRFKIVVAKKIKTPSGETKKKPKAVKPEGAPQEKSKKPGFFRKVFSRKAV